MSTAIKNLDLVISGGTDAGTHSLTFVAIDEASVLWSLLAPELIEEATVPTVAGSWGLSGANEYFIEADGSGDYLSLEDFQNDSSIQNQPAIVYVNPADTFDTNVTASNFLEGSSTFTRGGAIVIDDRRTAGTLVRSKNYASLPTPDSQPVGTTPDLSARVNPGDSANLGKFRRPLNQETGILIRNTAKRWWFHGISVLDQTSGVGDTPYCVKFETATSANIAEDIHFQQCTFEGQGPLVAGINKYANGVYAICDNFSLTDSTITGIDSQKETHGGWVAGGNKVLVRNNLIDGSSIPGTLGFSYPATPALHPRNVRWEYNHLRKETTNGYFAAKTGFEIKNGQLVLIQGNYIEGGNWGNSADLSNMAAIGIKAPGSPHAGRGGTVSVIARYNLIKNYLQFGYISNTGSSGARTRGCHAIMFHDNLGHQMGQGADGYVASGSPFSQLRNFLISSTVDSFGHRGPDAIGFIGNGIYAEDTLGSFGLYGINAGTNWNADGAAGRSYVCDNVFPRCNLGVQGDSTAEGGGTNYDACAVWGYNVHPAAPAATYPSTTWRPAGSTFDTTHLDSNKEMTASAVAAMETALGVGAGGQITSGTPVRRPDGTTFVRTKPGPDVTTLLSMFGDLDGVNVATAGVDLVTY